MSKSSRAQQLALLKARREGRAGFDDFAPEEAEQLFDEIDEDAYKADLRRRRVHDDFIVDDNGEGYVDDGREESDHGSYSDESDTDRRSRGKKPTKKQKAEDERRKKTEHDRINNGINKYLQAKSNAPKPVAPTTAEDTAFMDGLLGKVGADIFRETKTKPAPVSRPGPRLTAGPDLGRRPRKQSPPRRVAEPVKRAFGASHDPVPVKAEPVDHAMQDIDGDFAMHMDDDDIDVKDLPSSPIAHAMDRKTLAASASTSVPTITIKSEPQEDEFDDLSDLEVSEAVASMSAKTRTTPLPIHQAKVRPPVPALTPSKMAPLPSSSPTRPPPEIVDASQWTSVTERLNIQQGPAFDSVPFGKLDPADVVEPDGSVKMYWFDYTEVAGTLCLFGKVKDRKTGRFESAFLRIDNILRKLYFLPRENRHGGPQAGETVTTGDVFDEVDELMSKLRITHHKAKVSSRKYAFELPGIPPEADYLKLMYPYTQPELGPMAAAGGETYSHVFGSQTALFEQFVLWKGIMGPCWLKIEGADFKSMTNVSWCKFEMNVSKPVGISLIGRSEDETAPPMTAMSLAIRTAFNAKDNRQEIVLISARVYENLSISETTPAESLPCRTFSIIRPLENNFPIGFKTEAQKATGTIYLESNESVVLSKLMALIQNIDPDVFMGHRLDEVGLGLLMSRMRDRNTPGWHRLGRLRRNHWPKNIGRGHGSIFAERSLMTGRLVCDLANEMGKSTMLRCQNWSLTEMVSLGLDARRADIEEDATLLPWASKAAGLMNYVRHSETDTFFIAALALKVQLLPLTKVLTNLAGNSWARTLTGTRAERNEFILLHEFYRLKYICPDKRGPGAPAAAKGADGNGADAKKTEKYQGGLVFEPEKGLYEDYVLVMDFNSLYPSIIQEFNICFTTVERAGLDADTVPEVPSDQTPGVLPRLISTLVSRRREVKRLMTSKSATEDEKMTWDNKQMALKLTANSMYGCLGYARSRFYARPLAMLTTSKGREILRSTKDLAEKENLQVIYGDTDSVMINTRVRNLVEALAVGRTFKRTVNDQYRLLEIDIDSIFSRMLLHAKKKYAAMVVPFDAVGPNPAGKLEVKGLDMKRREFCALSKETSSKLLEFLLSGSDSDDVVIRIHEYLRQLAARMRSFEVPVQMYTIHTQLGKNPTEYDGAAANMPAVQVALREIANGKHVKAKDVMSFIIAEQVKAKTEPGEAEVKAEVKTEDEQAATTKSTSEGVPYLVADILRPGSNLRPHINYYLSKQILPPVERLCAPIAGTNPARMAECLGLDPTPYNQSANSNGSGSRSTELQPLESQIPDSIRFRDSHPPILRCRSCKYIFPFAGIADPASLELDLVTRDGIQCPVKTCRAVLPPFSIAAQVESQIRQHTARYYAGWVRCDDPSCPIRTRQISVAASGTRCIGSRGLAGTGCAGTVRPEYTDRMLYNQLLYLSRLFDADATISRVRDGKLATGSSSDEKDRIVILAGVNRDRFEVVARVVRAYLERNGRQWVDMRSLFSFAV